MASPVTTWEDGLDDVIGWTIAERASGVQMFKGDERTLFAAALAQHGILASQSRFIPAIEGHWRNLANIGISVLSMRWHTGVDEAFVRTREIMVNRHTKYGPGNITKFGEFGCVVRTSDKLARLEHLVDFPGDVHFDESIDDSWIDLVNYSLIAIMVQRQYWTLPAECLGESA